MVQCFTQTRPDPSEVHLHGHKGQLSTGLGDTCCYPPWDTGERHFSLRITKHLWNAVVLYGKRNRICVLTARRHLVIPDERWLVNSLLNILQIGMVSSFSCSCSHPAQIKIVDLLGKKRHSQRNSFAVSSGDAMGPLPLTTHSSGSS